MAKTLTELLRERFGVQVGHRINPLVSTVGTGATALVGNNPNRLALVIINLSANVIYVAPDFQVSTTRGIRLSPNGGQIALVWDEDFNIVGYEWVGISDVGTNAVFVLEVSSV